MTALLPVAEDGVDVLMPLPENRIPHRRGDADHHTRRGLVVVEGKMHVTHVVEITVGGAALVDRPEARLRGVAQVDGFDGYLLSVDDKAARRASFGYPITVRLLFANCPSWWHAIRGLRR